MEIRHTSEETVGQIYIPRINQILLAGVAILVLVFGSSSNLAAAYGISVTGAMIMDTLLAGFVVVSLWSWIRADIGRVSSWERLYTDGNISDVAVELKNN